MIAYRCRCGARWVEEERREAHCPECGGPVQPSDRPPSPIRERLAQVLAAWLGRVKPEGISQRIEVRQSLVADISRTIPIAGLQVATAYIGLSGMSYLREVAPDEYDDLLDRLVELVPDQGIPLFLTPEYAHAELAAARSILLGERRASA